MQAGFDALYLDFDTLLLADPVPAIHEAVGSSVEGEDGFEILVSRDFGTQTEVAIQALGGVAQLPRREVHEIALHLLLAPSCS